MKIHFSGIGGIGISALARYYIKNGNYVTGSDLSNSDLIESLCNEGVELIHYDNKIPNDTDLHVYSEAIKESDIQRVSAKEYKIKSISYFQALGEISKQFKTLAICGTHGKSTTTAMIGITLKNILESLICIVGTLLKEFDGKNIYISQKTSKNTWFVVEACEYRENFLSLNPSGVVLLNCEFDHIDYFKTFNNYKSAYIKLIKKIPKNGFLVANFDDPIVRVIAELAKCNVIPVYYSQVINPIKPKVPGIHNELNAELAKTACLTITNNQKEDIIKQNLKSYRGSWRRFDILGIKDSIEVIDDYAHHPTEIFTTLKAIIEYAKKRKIILVFQAHQYNRTKELFDDFSKCFDLLLDHDHVLFITDIYEARDSMEDKNAVSAKKLVDAIKARGINAEYSGDYKNSLEKIYSVISKNNVLITMGAGPVNQIANQFLL